MGGKDGLKALFCTWKGIDKVKRVLALCSGIGVLLCAVLSILNIFANVVNPINLIRQLWNCLFGSLMIFVQLNWVNCLAHRFGFLNNWFGRGMFYLFVGTNIMNPDADAGLMILTYVMGAACIFVGVVEILFGAKCAPAQVGQADQTESPPPLNAPSNAPSNAAGKQKSSFSNIFGGGGGGAGPSVGMTPGQGGAEPTFTVNVTPSQALEGAKFAAKAGAAVQAAVPPSESGGGAPANPFLGNQHLSSGK